MRETMKVDLFRVVVAACLASFTPQVVASEKMELSVDAFLGCRENVGYVLFFRLTNRGVGDVEIPEDLLPWSPSSFAMEFRLKPEGRAEMEPVGIVSDSWNRVVLAPGQEVLGEVRLSLLFPGKQLDAALASRDAKLSWKYSPVLGEDAFPPVNGEAVLLGGSFYEMCKKGLQAHGS